MKNYKIYLLIFSIGFGLWAANKNAQDFGPSQSSMGNYILAGITARWKFLARLSGLFFAWKITAAVLSFCKIDYSVANFMIFTPPFYKIYYVILEIPNFIGVVFYLRAKKIRSVFDLIDMFFIVIKYKQWLILY